MPTSPWFFARHVITTFILQDSRFTIGASLGFGEDPFVCPPLPVLLDRQLLVPLRTAQPFVPLTLMAEAHLGTAGVTSDDVRGLYILVKSDEEELGFMRTYRLPYALGLPRSLGIHTKPKSSRTAKSFEIGEYRIWSVTRQGCKHSFWKICTFRTFLVQPTFVHRSRS